jgi:hypothetical protein
MASGERGGAEALYDGLVHALRSAGHDAAEVPVHVDESTFESVIDSYARCYALDLRQYDLVISTKAPTFMVSHPNHVSYLVHTVRVFYDMFEAEYGRGSAAQHAQRRIVHALDRFGLRPGRVRRHFSIGATPSAACSTHRHGGRPFDFSRCIRRPCCQVSSGRRGRTTS